MNVETTRPIADLHANARNPRQVTKAKLKMLKNAVKEFGDLGGIVFNLTTNQLVGGHQRIEAYKDCGTSQINIERTYEPATPSGTVREGYLMIGGERHSYREVEWPIEKELAANLAANKQAGEWVLPELKDMLSELHASDFETALSMFDGSEIAALIGDQAESDSDTQKSELIEESYRVLVTCDHEEQQGRLIEMLQQEGYDCKPLVT